MKKLLIGILATSVFAINSYALASDICVAQKVSQVGYVGALKYQVNCSDNTEFESPETTTAVLFPLPFHWGKVTVVLLLPL